VKREGHERSPRVVGWHGRRLGITGDVLGHAGGDVQTPLLFIYSGPHAETRVDP
jgi:hypothetical protein